MAEVSRNQLLVNLIAQLRQNFSQALPPELDSAFVQRAYREICRQRTWHGLLKTGWLIFPKSYSGAVGTFTTFDRIVTTTDQDTVDYLTEIDALRNQLTRMSIIGPDGYNYHIHAAWLTANSATLQLDRPYLSPTAADGSFTIYKSYHLPPYTSLRDNLKDDPNTTPGLGSSQGIIEDATFRHFVSIRPSGQRGSRLGAMWVVNKPVASLPHQNLSNVPQALAPAGAIQDDFPGVSITGPLVPGVPIFQLTPAYNGDATLIYECRYATSGGELDGDNPYSRASMLPSPFTTELVVSLASVKAAAWAEANKSTRPELQKVRWMDLITYHQAAYANELELAARLDDELWSKDVNQDSRNGIMEALQPPQVDSNYNDYPYGYNGGILLDNGVVRL